MRQYRGALQNNQKNNKKKKQQWTQKKKTNSKEPTQIGRCHKNMLKHLACVLMALSSGVSHSKYSLKEILNVEENHDVIKGDRYLVELVRYFKSPLFIRKVLLVHCVIIFLQVTIIVRKSVKMIFQIDHLPLTAIFIKNKALLLMIMKFEIVSLYLSPL